MKGPIFRTEKAWQSFISIPLDRFIRTEQLDRHHASRWVKAGYLASQIRRRGKLRWAEYKRLVDMERPMFQKEAAPKVKRTDYPKTYEQACMRIGSLAALCGLPQLQPCNSTAWVDDEIAETES